ncbi:MAG: GPR endopeptidase [Oscillospiraceae bacterium]|nr:GPR endopeptidase [Oscillospiraceae bacterium]
MHMRSRTDLAVEARQMRGSGALEGVREGSGTRRGTKTELVEVLDERGAEALGKPVGKYLTLTPPQRFALDPQAFSDAALTLAESLRELLGPSRGLVLAAGLGNPSVTPDAFGPLTVRRMLVTRHLTGSPRFKAVRPVAAVEAGVAGTTGIESGELVAALTRELRPEAVIAIDALAARSAERLCATFQLTDTGVTPGSGVGNARRELSRATLGVPVIALGVPTVIEAGTLAEELSGAETERGDFFVTPRDVDSKVADAAKLAAAALNLALHEGLTPQEAVLN